MLPITVHKLPSTIALDLLKFKNKDKDKNSIKVCPAKLNVVGIFCRKTLEAHLVEELRGQGKEGYRESVCRK